MSPVATDLERLTLDGLSLHDGGFSLEELDLTPPKKLWEWARSADRDGAKLVRPPQVDLWEVPFKLRVDQQASMDLALTQLGKLVDRLAKAELRAAEGNPITATYVPSGSTYSYDIYVLGGEVEGLPRSWDAGWFAKNPEISVKLFCEPFGYGAWVESFTDTFDVDSISDYTFDAGAGTLSVSGGQLVPSSASEKRLWHSARGHRYTDAQVTLKITTGAVANPSAGIGVSLRRLDSSNNLLVSLQVVVPEVRILKFDGGVYTQLAAVAVAALAAATSYWIRIRAEGNLVTAEWFTSAPTATSTPAATVSYTLAGANATKFGAGVAGDVGIRIEAPTDWRYDDFQVDPNTARSSDPRLQMVIYGVGGDVPADAVLTLTDGAAQNQDHVEWGCEQRLLNTAAGTLVDSAALVTSGFAGAQTTRTGAYSASGVVRATLSTGPVAVCSTGDQLHVGPYRLKARIYPSTADVKVRLSWQAGDAPFRANEYAAPPAGVDAFSEVDLGVIQIPAVTSGTQRWVGRVEAYADTPGATVDIDYLVLVPTSEGYGKARNTLSFETPVTFSARDEFDQSAGALTGKTAPVGGVWAGAGDADDFTVETTGKTAQRAAVSDADSSTGRYAISGVAAMATQAVQVNFKFDTVPAGVASYHGVFGRYVDVNNWLMATLFLSTTKPELMVRRRLAGVVGTKLAAVDLPVPTPNTFYTIRLVIDANGRWWVWYFPTSTAPDVPIAAGHYAPLATGGALASGRPGFYDAHTAGNVLTRNFDNFQAFVPTVDAVIFSGSDLQIRGKHPVAQRRNGTHWGRPKTYRGTRFALPPAGQEGKVSRVVAKANRNDVDEVASDNVTDALQGSVAYRARFLVIPRS